MGEASPLVQLDDTLPGVTRVVMLFNAENPGHLAVVKDTVRASTQWASNLRPTGYGARTIWQKYSRRQPAGVPRLSLFRMM